MTFYFLIKMSLVPGYGLSKHPIHFSRYLIVNNWLVDNYQYIDISCQLLVVDKSKKLKHFIVKSLKVEKGIPI